MVETWSLATHRPDGRNDPQVLITTRSNQDGWQGIAVPIIPNSSSDHRLATWLGSSSVPKCTDHCGLLAPSVILLRSDMKYLVHSLTSKVTRVGDIER